MIALAANGFSPTGLTLGNMHLSFLELGIIAAVLVLIIVAVIAFRRNTKAQMKVSQYMDNETDTFNLAGMENYISKNKRRFDHPTLVVAKINNLESIYEHYPNKNKLMYSIANTFLAGLEKKEIAGRIDSDKFLIVYSGKNRDVVSDLCHKIEAKLVQKEFDHYGKYDFNLTFGVYEGPELKDPHNDIHKAVAALMYSKIKDKNVSYYGEEVSIAIAREQNMNDSKNDALANKRFVPFIQPKVSLKTGKIVGGEILCRWLDSDGNPLFYPGEFIPLFEKNGFVKQIDFLMLENACQLAQTLSQRGQSDIVISMNFSRLNFDSPTFVQDVCNVVSRYSVRNENIEIEVTESAIINSGSKISNHIMALRNLGFKVAMDDFGKEASSLGFLSTNPFDTIKMDMIFFRDRLSTEKNRMIVKGMIEMLEGLKFETVCEGIEDTATLDILATMSTDVIIQGYVFSKPIPIQQFEMMAGTVFKVDYPDPKESKVPAVDLSQIDEQPVDAQQASWMAEMQRQMDEMRRQMQNKPEPAPYAYREAPRNDNSELLSLKAEIESLKAQKKKDAERAEIDDLKAQLAALKNTVNEEDDFEDPEDDLEPDYGDGQEEKNYAEDEVNALYAQLEIERQEREELEAMLASIQGDADAEDEDFEGDEEAIEKEADDNLNLDIDSILDDDASDDYDDDDAEPELTQDEVEKIIRDYQRKYSDEWNTHAKSELANYAELLNGLKYYQEHQMPKTLVGKAKKASEAQKKIYNIVKNELLKYNGVTNTLTKNFDCFYMGRKLIAKLSFTATKIRIYLGVNPSDYPERQFPHKDVSNKKAHARTPYYALLSSQLSVRRIQKVIADMMNNLGTEVNESYKPLDYAIKFKFMKKDQ